MSNRIEIINSGRPVGVFKTLEYAINAEPGSFTKYDKGAYRSLRPGSLIKLWVEAVGQAKPCPECFWAIVVKVNHKKKTLFCEVNNRLTRTKYHGIKFRDILNVNFDNIVDIGLTSVTSNGLPVNLKTKGFN